MRRVFLTVVLALLCSTAFPGSASIGFGGSDSNDLGEQSGSASFYVKYEDPQRFTIEPYFDTSGKLNSSGVAKGSILGVFGDYYPTRNALIGLRVQRRSGDGFVKNRAFLRVGTSFKFDVSVWTLAAESALTSRERESSLSLRSVVKVFPHGSIEFSERLVLYDQGTIRTERKVGNVTTLKVWITK